MNVVDVAVIFDILLFLSGEPGIRASYLWKWNFASGSQCCEGKVGRKWLQIILILFKNVLYLMCYVESFLFYCHDTLRWTTRWLQAKPLNESPKLALISVLPPTIHLKHLWLIFCMWISGRPFVTILFLPSLITDWARWRRRRGRWAKRKKN